MLDLPPFDALFAKPVVEVHVRTVDEAGQEHVEILANGEWRIERGDIDQAEESRVFARGPFSPSRRMGGRR